MKTMLGTALAAILAGAGPQEEWVDNPDYLGWSKHKPGAWVRYIVRIDSDVVSFTETTWKLVEVTPDQATVDEITWVPVPGIAERREETVPRIFHSKVRKGTDSSGAKLQPKGEGDLVLVIKGRDYKCRVTDFQVLNGTQEGRVKTWRCDTIPGGIVNRESRRAENNRNRIVTLLLDDYQGRPAGEEIDNPDYTAWAAQRPGAWVKWKNHARDIITEMLREVTAVHAVVERSVARSKTDSNVSTLTVPAKIEKGSDAEGWKVEPVAEGDEELDIKGTKVACHWVQLKITMTGPSTVRKKIWRCPRIVGGMARIAILDVDGAVKTFSEVVDWKAAER